MSDPTQDFKYLWEEVRVFNRNLGKDNNDRRYSIKVIEDRFRKLDNFKTELRIIRDKFNSINHGQKIVEQAKLYVIEINKYLDCINSTLSDRLSTAQARPLQPEASFFLIPQIPKTKSGWLRNSI